MKYKKSYFYAESVTFGDRITKFVDFDKLPKHVQEGGCDGVLNYLVENYLLKDKRPYGLLFSEKLLLMCK